MRRKLYSHAFYRGILEYSQVKKNEKEKQANNFFSNAIFLIIPPILSIKYKNYGEVLKVPVGYVWSLLTIVGLGSIYFHSTLSLVGQLVDEIAILWVIMCAWALFLPTSMLRKIFFNSFGESDH